jgi:hypothetical protein
MQISPVGHGACWPRLTHISKGVHDFFDLFLPPSLAPFSVLFTEGMFESVIKYLNSSKAKKVNSKRMMNL